MTTTDTLVYLEEGRAWTFADAEAAYREGWAIFDSDGSESGPFQVQKFDSGDEAGDGIPEWERDTDAWEVMGYSRLAHHRHALDFLAVANPMEHLAIARWCNAVEVAALTNNPHPNETP